MPVAPRPWSLLPAPDPTDPRPTARVVGLDQDGRAVEAAALAWLEGTGWAGRRGAWGDNIRRVSGWPMS